MTKEARVYFNPEHDYNPEVVDTTTLVIDTDLIEEVASEYDVPANELRTAATEFQTDPEMITTFANLNTDYEVTLVGQTETALYVLAPGWGYWDADGDHLGLSSTGLAALVELHARQLLRFVDPERRPEIEARLDRDEAFVFPSPEFPPEIVTRIAELESRTVLKPREAQVQAFKEAGFTHKKIAEKLGIAKGSVDSLSSRIRDRVQRAYETVELIEIASPFVRSKTDPLAADFFGLEWSEWHALDPAEGELARVSNRPGVYRVRHTARPGLTYIGETGRGLRERIQSLARGVYAEEMPFRDPHTAAPCLWALREECGPQFEVSVATPDLAVDDQHRKGIEATLLAVYRHETGSSPTANFGRIIPGYEQSSYRSENSRGGRNDDAVVDIDGVVSSPPLEWVNVEGITHWKWMGLEWSRPIPLYERLGIEAPDSCVYRIWYPEEADDLAYIGESSRLQGRLQNHEATFGGDAVVAYASTPDVEATERKELEMDLIGAHYLATGNTPIAQFGHRDNLPVE